LAGVTSRQASTVVEEEYQMSVQASVTSMKLAV
jgi:hypothetical protein